jgi:hypothetical protein
VKQPRERPSPAPPSPPSPGDREGSARVFRPGVLPFDPLRGGRRPLRWPVADRCGHRPRADAHPRGWSRPAMSQSMSPAASGEDLGRWAQPLRLVRGRLATVQQWTCEQVLGTEPASEDEMPPACRTQPDKWAMNYSREQAVLRARGTPSGRAGAWPSRRACGPTSRSRASSRAQHRVRRLHPLTVVLRGHSEDVAGQDPSATHQLRLTTRIRPSSLLLHAPCFERAACIRAAEPPFGATARLVLHVVVAKSATSCSTGSSPSVSTDRSAPDQGLAAPARGGPGRPSLPPGTRRGSAAASPCQPPRSPTTGGAMASAPLLGCHLQV